MARIPICASCGHPVFSDAIAARLCGKQRRLYEVVQAAGARGLTASQIMNEIYADDPNGGPESSNIVSVMVRIVNLHLEHFGLAIRGQRGPGGFYRLATSTPESMETT
jgi:hypothetical protein